jgi:hypothetical protein
MSVEGLVIVQNLVDFERLIAESKLRNCEDKIRYKIIRYVPIGNISCPHINSFLLIKKMLSLMTI